MHLDRMVDKRELSDVARKNAIRDLIGDTKLDYQVGTPEDPLAIESPNGS